MPRLFDNPFSDEAAAAWDQLKRQYERGDELSGKVVQQAPFGVFLDAGVGFLVLLEVIEFETAGGKPHAFPTDYPALGSEVTGHLSDFTDHNRQLRITQRFEERARERPGWYAQ
jgi:ribosomal protein S1